MRLSIVCLISDMKIVSATMEVAMIHAIFRVLLKGFTWDIFSHKNTQNPRHNVIQLL